MLLSPSWMRLHPYATLVLILAVGMTIRMVCSLSPGYGFDVSVNQKWARSAAELGIAQSYKQQLDQGIPPEYPPVAQFIFAGTGHLYRLLISRTFDYDSVSLRVFIKLPAIIADLLICLLLFMVLRTWKGVGAGLLAATAYALHPAAIYDSAVWGQTDAIFTLFLLGAIIAWIRGRPIIAIAIYMLALLVKVQAVLLLPLFGLLLLHKPRLLLRATLISLLIFELCLIPFMIGGSVQEVLNVYAGAVGRYTNLSVGAYNFWWSLLADRSSELTGSALLFTLLKYQTVAYSLFGFSVIMILFVCRKKLFKGSPDALFHASALMSGAFFLLLPQMHERYMFPFVVLGLPLAFISRRLALFYWVASLAFFMNLVGVLPFSWIDKALYAEFPSLDVLIAASIVWMILLIFLEAVERYKPFEREHAAAFEKVTHVKQRGKR